MWTKNKGRGIIVFIFFLLFIVSFSPDVSAVCGDGVCNETETCSNCNQDCGTCCGNNIIDTGETCSSCPSDVKCANYEQCINGICTGFCGNLRMDQGETCSNCPTDVKCANDERCENGVCKGYCGNNKRDGGEDCNNCPQDVFCREGWLCSNNGICVELGTSENCASLGDSCGTGFCVNSKCVECRNNKDCESKKVYGEGFICSPDNKYVLEKGYELSGICKEGKCTGEKIPITPRNYEDCGDSFCQDGTCGCSEGFNACKKIGKCEKVSNLGENSACGCDFQCSSGYCSNDGKCITPLNVVLSSTKNKIDVGEETRVTLSVDNNLNKKTNVNFAINIGDGFEMSDIISGMDCSGNQCKSSIEIPERGRKEVTVALVGEKAIAGKIGAQITYFMDDLVERTLKNIEDTNIIVTHCGDSACTEGETMQNCCMDCGCPNTGILSDYTCSINKGCEKKTKNNVLIWFYIVVFFGLIFGYKKFTDLKKDSTRIEEAKEKLRQKNHIKEVLLTLKISPKKHPTPKEIIKKLNDDYKIYYEDNTIREAYIEFLNKLEGKPQYPDDSTGMVINKFCSNCGKLTRMNKEFCHNCGKSVIEPSTDKIMKYCGKCGKGIKEIGDFCPYCGKKIAHRIAGLNTYQTFYKKVPKSDKKSEKIKTEQSKIKQKNGIIAILLAFFFYPLAAGYIYLRNWKRFWISIAVVYGLIIFGGESAFTITMIYVFWTMYDCYKLARITKRH